MQFSGITFYSANSKCLSAFLNEMFDTEMSFDQSGSVIHHSEALIFEIRDLLKKRKKNLGTEGEHFEFSVDDASGLSEIKQKVEFFCYKQNLKSKDFIKEDGLRYLLIEDPDGRSWKFSTPKNNDT